VWLAAHLGRPSLDPMALGLATIGALPDIDHPSSWVGRRLRLIRESIIVTGVALWSSVTMLRLHPIFGM
jgi:hypothetical protein